MLKSGGVRTHSPTPCGAVAPMDAVLCLAFIEGRNIYEIFEHNIAYEIRLQKAMEEDLLCPFHYFGITDFEIIDDEMVNGKKLTTEQKLENFRFLTSDGELWHYQDQIQKKFVEMQSSV